MHTQVNSREIHQTDETYADVLSSQLRTNGEIVTEESLPVQTVGHITGYCPDQRDTITAAHHATWRTLQSVMTAVTPKGWTFPSVNGELTIGLVWKDNKMDEICTIESLWEAARDSEIQKTHSPTDEETCAAAHDLRKSRQLKAKRSELFLRVRPDGISQQ